MLDTLHQILHWNIIQSNPALRTPRRQNSSYFKQKLWNRAENRERDWGETPKFFSLASQAQRACEVRALRARKTLYARFTDFFTDFEKKTDFFAV